MNGSASLGRETFRAKKHSKHRGRDNLDKQFDSSSAKVAGDPGYPLTYHGTRSKMKRVIVG